MTGIVHKKVKAALLCTMIHFMSEKCTLLYVQITQHVWEFEGQCFLKN